MVSQQSTWEPPYLEPLELGILWLLWPAFLEQHVQGKEKEHLFWSVFGDHLVVHLESSPHSLVSDDTVSETLEGRPKAEVRTLRVPA